MRNERSKAPKDTPAWRDPVGLGFRAHRSVLLLRFRLRDSAANRRPPRRSRSDFGVLRRARRD